MPKMTLSKEEKLLNKVETILDKQEKSRWGHDIFLALIVFSLTIFSGVIVYNITTDKSPDLNLDLKLVEDRTIQIEVSNDDEQNVAKNVKIFMREYEPYQDSNWLLINSKELNNKVKNGHTYFFNISLDFDELPIDNDAFYMKFLEGGIDLTKLNITNVFGKEKLLILSQIHLIEGRDEQIELNRNMKNQQYEFMISCDNCKESDIFPIKNNIEVINTGYKRCIEKEVCGYFKRIYIPR